MESKVVRWLQQFAKLIALHGVCFEYSAFLFGAVAKLVYAEDWKSLDVGSIPTVSTSAGSSPALREKL